MAVAVLLAAAVLLWGERVVAGHHLLQGDMVRLHLHHLRNALVAFPLFLAWLEFSRARPVARPLDRLRAWWLTSRAPLFIAPAVFVGLVLAVTFLGFSALPKGDALWCFFQTKIFALGRLSVPAPVYPEFFWARSIFHDGRWFSYTSPGHSLVLLPGYLLGATWVLGPVAAVAFVWLAGQLGRTAFGSEGERISLLLVAVSPMAIVLFASQDFHITSLVFGCLALYLLTRTRADWPVSVAAGLCLGMMFLARPLTAIGFGLPLMVYAVIKLRRRSALFFLAGAAMVALHLLYNRHLTGDWLTFPYQLMGKEHGVGFAPDFGVATFGLQGHSPLKTLVNLGYNTFALNLQLFGWLLVSAMFVPFGFSEGSGRRNWPLWSSAIGLVVAYAFYWFHGTTPWGAKYWSEALPFLVVFTAGGIRNAGPLLERWFSCRKDLLPRALAFLMLYSLLVVLPTDISAIRRWRETPALANSVKAAGLHNALVFIADPDRPAGLSYTSGFMLTDPLLGGVVVYARDLGPDENRRLRLLYPDRSAWLYDLYDDELAPVRDSSSP